MKKALLLLGMIAAGAASGGVVAWSILSPAEKNGTHVVTPQSGAVSDDPFSQAGTHFTSYQAEQYPDLTIINASEQVDRGGRGGAGVCPADGGPGGGRRPARAVAAGRGDLFPAARSLRQR